jgi:hypothetical protein
MRNLAVLFIHPNLRIVEVTEIKTVPYVALSHPFVERLIGTIRREYLDHMSFWTSAGTTSLSIGMWNAKAIRWAMRGQPQLGLRCFISTTAQMSSALGPFGPDFRRRFGEDSMRYFRWLMAL